jgi:hypothetical protein
MKIRSGVILYSEYNPLLGGDTDCGGLSHPWKGYSCELCTLEL